MSSWGDASNSTDVSKSRYASRWTDERIHLDELLNEYMYITGQTKTSNWADVTKWRDKYRCANKLMYLWKISC